MGLSVVDKARIRGHLGYPNISLMSAMQEGIPSATQPMFVLEPAMDNVLDEALPLIYQELDLLDAIDAQLKAALPRLAAIELGDLKLRTGRSGESEGDLLRREYRYHQQRLANQLGVWVNGLSVFGGASGAAIGFGSVPRGIG